jgi:hypothetical protein
VASHLGDERVAPLAHENSPAGWLVVDSSAVVSRLPSSKVTTTRTYRLS